jgi:hypothetical protein
MGPESIVEAQSRRYAKANGCELYKVRFAGRVGFPDRLLVCPPDVSGNSRLLVLAVEFKAPRGRVSDVQHFVHKELRTLGVEVWVISSFENFQERLDVRLR